MRPQGFRVKCRAFEMNMQKDKRGISVVQGGKWQLLLEPVLELKSLGSQDAALV